MEEFYDFDFLVTHTGKGATPAWMGGRNPYRGRVYRSAVEAALGGPLPQNVRLASGFRVARTAIELAAVRKVIARKGEIEQPVLVTETDLAK